MIGWISFLALYLSLFAKRTSASADALVRRDKNLPARLPYVFPAPGTSEASRPRIIHSSLSHERLQIADHIRSRRTNGTLLALDGMLWVTVPSRRRAQS